jgi:nucleoside-diphosphate-sugar epimerase
VLDATGESGIRAAVVRLFTVYGPGEHATRLLPSLMNAARLGATVSLTTGDQPRDFTYVDDAVEGLLRTGARSGASGWLLNVATGRLTTVRQFAEAAAAVLAIPRDRLRFGALPQQPGEMYHGEVSTARVDRVLGWHPAVSITDGVHRTWEQERSNR